MPADDCCNTKFARVKHFGNTNAARRLILNLKYYLEWSLLNIGAWIDMVPGVSGIDTHTKLRLELSPGYDDGNVWAGLRKNWVYETGVQYTDVDGGSHTPITQPDVYVNSVVQPTGNYQIDYDAGRVIFSTSAPASTSAVNAHYSAKNVQIYIGDDTDWFQELQTDGWDYSKHFTQNDDGNFYSQSKNRIQLPSIVIASWGNARREPFELGDRCIKMCQDVIFHVLAQDQCMRDNLCDILVLEAEKCVHLFNVDSAHADCDIMLYNYTESGNKSYPHLVNKHPWAYTRGTDATAFDLDTPLCGLHTGFVRVNYCTVFNSL